MSITELERLMVLRDLVRLSGKALNASYSQQIKPWRAGSSAQIWNPASIQTRKEKRLYPQGSLIEIFMLFQQPCSQLLPLLPSSGLSIVAPEMAVCDALCLLEHEGHQYALVQDSSKATIGIFSQMTVQAHRALKRRRGKQEDDLESSGIVSQYLSNKFALEATRATVLEVIERMTVGKILTILVVDERGRPEGVLTPSLILSVLPSLRSPLGVISTYARKATTTSLSLE
ncbi:MAG: CBS domain-containing protein [Bdellovibrionota bacterium]